MSKLSVSRCVAQVVIQYRTVGTAGTTTDRRPLHSEAQIAELKLSTAMPRVYPFQHCPAT
jgi:hypothetical protein